MSEQNDLTPNIARVSQAVRTLVDAMATEPGDWRVDIYKGSGQKEYTATLTYRQEFKAGAE